MKTTKYKTRTPMCIKNTRIFQLIIINVLWLNKKYFWVENDHKALSSNRISLYCGIRHVRLRHIRSSDIGCAGYYCCPFLTKPPISIFFQKTLLFAMGHPVLTFAWTGEILVNWNGYFMDLYLKIVKKRTWKHVT